VEVSSAVEVLGVEVSFRADGPSAGGVGVGVEVRCGVGGFGTAGSNQRLTSVPGVWVRPDSAAA
jgi:hypothetical protein